MTLPLEGVKAVEFAEHAFVPASAAVLAEWGADVIKIERRDGDALREIGYLEDFDMSYYFELFNRNKRDIALDVETPAGRGIFEKLVVGADVFITNHLPRVQRRLGTRPDDIFAINPRIVYARGSGQGQRGPDAETGGNDNVAYWSRSGVAYMLSDAASDDIIPQRGAIGDAPSGIALAAGILAGLLHARHTGQGVEVNASLFNTGMWTLGPDIALSSLTGEVPARRSSTAASVAGSPLQGGPLSARYRTADGRDVALSMTNERRYWARACRALGLSGLIEKYPDPVVRQVHREELLAQFRDRIASLTAEAVADQLRAEDCVYAFINTPLDVLHDPAALANGYLLDHPKHPRLRLAAIPAQFDDTLPVLTRAAPELGEHSRQILEELGYPAERIDELVAEGTVGPAADRH